MVSHLLILVTLSVSLVSSATINLTEDRIQDLAEQFCEGEVDCCFEKLIYRQSIECPHFNKRMAIKAIKGIYESIFPGERIFPLHGLELECCDEFRNEWDVATPCVQRCRNLLMTPTFHLNETMREVQNCRMDSEKHRMDVKRFVQCIAEDGRKALFKKLLLALHDE